MSERLYRNVCIMLDCDPDKGLSLPALRLTYAADGASADDDYAKVFGAAAENKTESKAEDDDVIEMGEGGFDILS